MQLLNHFKSKPTTIEERFQLGKELRKKFPRIAQGEYKPAPDRADPVSILEEQAKTRFTGSGSYSLCKNAYFTICFFRGAAAIMAADLSANGETSGITVQACGDMHVANFGVFASAERNLIFGINDFDETLPGPWEWDLKRLVASIVAAGRFLGADKDLCRRVSDGSRKHLSQKNERVCIYGKYGVVVFNHQ